MITLNLESPRRYSVIFADDDPDLLRLYDRVARIEGWDVETASTAEELLDKVRARYDQTGPFFDIVITDVSFFGGANPGVSGIAAGRQLERAFPNLPILFLTGYGGLLTRENISDISTADYLEKPVDVPSLVRRIRHLIQFTRSRYDGPDRRRESCNLSATARRSSDKPLGVPKVLALVMGR